MSEYTVNAGGHIHYTHMLTLGTMKIFYAAATLLTVCSSVQASRRHSYSRGCPRTGTAQAREGCTRSGQPGAERLGGIGADGDVTNDGPKDGTASVPLFCM